MVLAKPNNPLAIFHSRHSSYVYIILWWAFTQFLNDSECMQHRPYKKGSISQSVSVFIVVLSWKHFQQSYNSKTDIVGTFTFDICDLLEFKSVNVYINSTSEYCFIFVTNEKIKLSKWYSQSDPWLRWWFWWQFAFY